MARPVERVSVGLVACAATKAAAPAPARLLYRSELFRRASAYAAAAYDHWLILSAQHFVLHPDELVAPYDQAVAGMRKVDREHWASLVELGLRCGCNYRTEGRLDWPARPAPDLLLGEWIEEGRAAGIARRVDLWFHAGAAYVEPVRHHLATRMPDLPYDLHAPLAGLGIGQQLAWYRRREPALF